MIEFSSFMVPWNAIFLLFSGNSLIGMIALGFLLYMAQGKLTALDPHCTQETFWNSLLVTGICSIIAVLVLQIVANIAYSLAFSGGAYTQGTVQFARSLEHSRGGIAILLITILIGGGYAFAFADVSLPTHLFSCTVGIGFLEESAKCVAALAVFDLVYRKQGSRYSFAPFVIAGLGFGWGEALHYFGGYNMAECPLPIYLVRALWCVLLHAAWALIAGDRIVRRFKGIPNVDSMKQDDYLALLGCLLPSIVLHGVYDAFCFQGIPLAWIVGIVSLIWGFSIFGRPKAKFAAKQKA